MNKSINKFNKACKEMGEYIEALSFLPPLGEGAKEQAIKEWEQCINKVKQTLNNIKEKQIELLLKGGWNE